MLKVLQKQNAGRWSKRTEATAAGRAHRITKRTLPTSRDDREELRGELKCTCVRWDPSGMNCRRPRQLQRFWCSNWHGNARILQTFEALRLTCNDSVRPSPAVCITKQNHYHLPNTDPAGHHKIRHYDRGTSTVKRQRRFSLQASSGPGPGLLLERSSDREAALPLQWHKET